MKRTSACRMIGRALLLSSSVLPSYALAQSPTAEPAALAQSPTAESADLGDIVVTAQRRAQNLQDVPASILAVTGSELARLNITSGQDLMAVVPDLRATSAVGTLSQQFSIRGVGPANNYNTNVQQPVGFYMDEAYQGFTAAPGAQYFDIERVEVLKGPQGTLYGRNTTGGAVNIITKKPKLEAGNFDGYVTAGYGNYDRFEVQGASDLTLVDGQLGLRIAATHLSRDGYIKNVGSTGPDTFNAVNMTQGRIQLRAKPTENLDIVLGAYFNDFDGTSTAQIPYGIYDGTPPYFTSIAPLPNGYSRAGLGFWQAENDFHPDIWARTRNYTASISLELGDWNLVSVSNYQDNKAFISNDCDGTPLVVCKSQFYNDQEAFSQDVRAVYEGDNFNAILGVGYAHDTFHQTFDAGFGSTNISNSYEQERTSKGVFFDVTYTGIENLELTLGVRNTSDTTEMRKVRTRLLDAFGDGVGNPIGLLIPTPGPFTPDTFLPEVSRDTSGFTGRAVIAYNFSPDIKAYATYSTGYRAGAFNGLQLFSPNELNFVDSEKTKNYEAGIKATLARGTTFNVTGFYMDLENQHVQSAQNIPATPTTPAAAFPILAGLGGRIYGLEFDLRVRALENLTLTASGSVLRSKYKNTASNEISGVPVGGNRFPFAPKFAVRAGVEWTAWDTGDKRLVFNGDVDVTGHFFFDPTNGSDSVGLGYIRRKGQPTFALIGGSATFEMKPFAFSVWGKNLLNQHTVLGTSNAEGSFGESQATVGEPRTFGGSVTFKF